MKALESILSTNASIWVAIIGGLVALVKHLWDKYQEKKSCNKAILTEIRRLDRVIKAHEKFWNDCIDDGNTNQALIPFSTDVYDKLVQNLGLINNKIIGRVVDFYGYLKFVNATQLTKDFYDKDNRSKEFNTRYKKVLQTLRQDYLGIYFNESYIKYGLS